LIAALIEMQDIVQKTGTMSGREFGKRTTATGPMPMELDEIRRSREALPIVDLPIYNHSTLN
jgi:NADH-quinone oxidoreductase subunit B